MLKRLLIILVLAITTFMGAADLAKAEDYGLTKTSEAIGYTSNYNDVYGIVNKVISTFLSLLAILFFTLTVYSGVRWMTARGNEEYTKKAKGILEAAILGLIIVILAYGLVAFIFQKLGA